ncbi:hypothetical protein E4T45_11905 [Aureobasidium sp. EXF-8846]|nr:hypothetical protein E4T45_11905 [Aureobasidium sp. EXF-8846]
MPPKRAKKAPAVSKDQGRLNFQRLQKPQTTVSPLVQILSQYQLMIMITDQLSSADIIHLIATCKEIKMYLTDDKNIYANIQENANCDGKGIEARAKCFGHWNGDVTKAMVECGGSNCLPCDDCEAMVCNECRYHVTYMDNLSCCRNDPFHWQGHEVEYAEDLEIVNDCHHDCDECPAFHSSNFPIEGIRATHLLGETRERHFCADCRPYFCNEKGPRMERLLRLIDERETRNTWCSCTLVDKFIKGSWLCIPCFIKQEAEAYSRPLKKNIFEWKKSEDGSRKLVKTQEYLCDCGRVANAKYLVECRWCEEYMYTPDISALFAAL